MRACLDQGIWSTRRLEFGVQSGHWRDAVIVTGEIGESVIRGRAGPVN